MNPMCIKCGGPWPLLTTTSKVAGPRLYQNISRDLPEAMLSMTVKQAGFVPLSLLEVTTDKGNVQIFRLPGRLEQLVQTVGDSQSQLTLFPE